MGSPRLGEWEERGRKAYHIRRRLSVAEAAVVGAVCDLRGTAEGALRFERIKSQLSYPALLMAAEELGQPSSPL